MDARQRLNQLRRFKPKGGTRGRNQRSIGGGQRVTDLRQKISNNNRIGKQSAITTTRRQNGLQLHTRKRVSLDDERRLPTVSVNLSRIRDNTGFTSAARKRTRHEPSPRAHRQTVSSTQPILIPQMVHMLPQTSSAATYGMSSAASIQPKSYVNDDSKCTVLVSNLNPTITLSDINELFGEIGSIVRTSRVNNSMVFIVYEDIVSAKNACQTYHNRLLDGLPMSCNILSQSVNEFEIDPQPATTSYQQTFRRAAGTSGTALFAQQLRQINETQEHRPTVRQTFVGNRRRPNTTSARFRLNF